MTLEFYVSHQEARTAFLLGVGATIPFVLRFIGDFVINKTKEFTLQKCCNKTEDEMKEQFIGTGKGDLSIDCIMQKSTSWTDAKKIQHLNFCAAFTISLTRLVFWHWMQPLLYWFVLYAYWDLLDKGQQILGLIVGGRECIYFILTIFGLCINPTFLMPDLKATWKYKKETIPIYVIAPHAYVFACVAPKTDSPGIIDCLNCLGFVTLILMDLCGAVAFVWAFIVKNVYVPMMIGYSVTAIGGLFMIFIACIGWTYGF
eukprot:550135_1